MRESSHDHRKRSRSRDDTDDRRVRMRRDGERHGRYSSRDRSRSPRSGEGRHHSRPRSPTRHRHRHHHRSHHQEHEMALPFNARQLSRSNDLDAFRPLLASYLDIQKRIDIAAIDERELRGRWKSFVSKWNSGELAEGWYRPETFEDAAFNYRAEENRPDDRAITSQERRRGSSAERIRTTRHDQDDIEAGNRETTSHNTYSSDEDEDDYGPTLPSQGYLDEPTKPHSQKHGPGIPTISDITLRRELEAADRDDARAQLRHERKADRALQKERLDELAPKADAGSRARTLEKRREVRDANASFAKAKGANDMAEVPDSELMGGGDGGIEEYKRMKREAERRKTEREVRREEVARARREEREERIKGYREREASTVDMLREIARSRFG